VLDKLHECFALALDSAEVTDYSPQLFNLYVGFVFHQQEGKLFDEHTEMVFLLEMVSVFVEEADKLRC
jgi:hypothetical protein